MILGRADIDTFDEYRRAHSPGRGSLNVLALVKGGGMFRYRLRRERIASSRARDVSLVVTSTLAGVAIGVVIAIAAVSWRVAAQ